MTKKKNASTSPRPHSTAKDGAAPETVKEYTDTLLPLADPDDEYDSFLGMENEEETPQTEAKYSAVLWPELPEPEEVPLSSRRMTKEAFTRALADAMQRSSPVYQFRTVSANTILRLQPQGRAIVDAPPGSGKTWTLVRRALRLAAAAPRPEDIILLCSTPTDKEHLLERLHEAGRRSKQGDAWKRLTVLTFDAYAAHLLEVLAAAHPSQRISLEGRTGQSLPDAGLVLGKHPELLADVRHVLVDDIQNIVGPTAAFFLQLTAALPETSGFTYFGDRCQALFDLPAAKSNYASADQLYGQLMRANPEAALLSLSGNRRSTEEMVQLAEPFREALLTGRPGRIAQAAASLLHKVRSQDIAWQDLHPTSLRSLVTGKTLGILTRTKGEALAISNLLYQGGITHNLLLEGQGPRWAGWLGRVLLAHEGTSLDQESFAAVFADLYPGTDAVPYWQALSATQPDPLAGSYQIRDLLAAVHRLPDRSELGPSPDEEPAAVTVSTIRMSRGREFDTVLLASDLFNGGGYTDRAQREAARRSDAEALAESRLVYVGLTRARKKLYLMMLPLEAVRLSQIRSRRPARAGRWYKSQVRRLPTTVLKSYRRRSLRAFEVSVDDLAPESFAENEDAQTYLLTSAPDLPDAEMELRFIDNKGQPSYGLFDPEQAALQLGRSTDEFVLELTTALGYARNLKRDSIGPEHFPEAFRDLYVQRVATHIGAAAEAPPHAKISGDQAVWLGLDVIGFARAVDSAPPAKE